MKFVIIASFICLTVAAVVSIGDNSTEADEVDDTDERHLSRVERQMPKRMKQAGNVILPMLGIGSGRGEKSFRNL